MADYRIDAGLARLFKLGLDADITEKVTTWKERLDQGVVTEEMRHVFFGLGYLSSLRDPRIKPEEQPNEGTAVEIAEPSRDSASDAPSSRRASTPNTA